MTGSDLLALLPLLLLGGTAVIALVGIAVRRSHAFTAGLTIVGLAVAFFTLPIAARGSPRQVTALLTVDPFGLFWVGLIVAGALATAFLSVAYLNRLGENREELYVLLLLATLGSSVLALSRHLASFFLGLETLSISLYGMIAYARARRVSTEAGLKYLILAAASSAFLLFGMALLYAGAGTLELSGLVSALTPNGVGSPFLLVGGALVLVGIGFKLAVVPFHLWTPDVYQGAPAPVTGFVATVSKGGVIAILLRLLVAVGQAGHASFALVIGVLAIASMFVGNLLALLQKSVKRLLAYSSIAHMGYVLVAILASGALAAEAATFYMVAYFVTTLGAFGVVTVLSDGGADRDAIDDYRGLYWRRPWLAALMSACLFSLSGIPLTAGFIGKYYVVAAAVDSSLWWPVLMLVVNSAISVYYYLRVIVAMYTPTEEAEAVPAGPAATLVGSVALIGLAVLLVWLGVSPAPFMNLLHPAAAALM